jgi:hypothetical protein
MKQPDLTLTTRVQGEYRLVLNKGTDREVDSGWRPNLVLDQGLDTLSSPVTQVIQYCCVGTGTTAPANNQTALVAYLASSASGTNAGATNIGSPTYANQYTRSYVFAQGAVVGNITELGVTSSSSSGSLLFSRCLLVDGSNVPTALTVVALDQLTVYYRITITPVVTDLSSSVTISGTGYAYTCRMSSAASFMVNAAQIFTNGAGGICAVSSTNPEVRGTGATIGTITGAPTGGTTVTGSTTWTNNAYTNGNFYRDSTITWAPAAGNATGGIKTLYLRDSSGNWAYQWQFTTQIPKDNTKTLTLVVRIAWSR